MKTADQSLTAIGDLKKLIIVAVDGGYRAEVEKEIPIPQRERGRRVINIAAVLEVAKHIKPSMLDPYLKDQIW